MKIGIDIRLIGKNQTGSEAYFFNLVKNLSAIDKINEYRLFTDRDPKIDPGLAKIIEELKLGENFKVDFVKNTNKFYWNLWYLPMNLKKNPVDVYHTQYITPFWLPKKTKLLSTIHDISFNYFPEFIKKSDLFFLKVFIPRSIRQADKIITVSASEMKKIIDFYKIPPEKVDFSYNGVDFEKFCQQYSDEGKEAIRKKYNLPKKFLLYIGTLQPRKNIPVIIEALKNSDLKLVLVGDREAHNFDKKIDKVIEKNNLGEKVVFPGWIDEKDKPILLQIADCFVFSSLYEGFGIPIIEAMAANTPVVCSDIPVHQEIGKGAALFCDPRNFEDFSEKINQVLTNTEIRSNLIEQGAAVARRYSWQKTAKKTLEIYLNLNQ
jgi:glycosyltransferase involved in cell wall biosynthesis